MNVIERPETRPDIPRKIRWKAKLFGSQCLSEYLWNYYEKESEVRAPFYLPYIYMKENFYYLRRYAQIPKKQVSMVLIDGDDSRTDYFLYEFLEELNYLTIVTDRRKYFESLQERAFQELGLLIDLVLPWEEKNIRGNLVWDFTDQMQKTDCYPEQSVCFLPHKKEWKIRELLKDCPVISAVSLKEVEIGEACISAALAESLLVPPNFPFRKSRCEDLREWCRNQKWTVKMSVQSAEKP